jgi:hypothetical protein
MQGLFRRRRDVDASADSEKKEVEAIDEWVEVDPTGQSSTERV